MQDCSPCSIWSATRKRSVVEEKSAHRETEGKVVRKKFRVRYEWDIVSIRSEIREIAGQVGFDELDQARIVQSVSELARNVVHYAEKGLILVETVERDGKEGLRILVQDLGPGITDMEEVFRKMDTPTVTENSGLQQVRSLMDEFSIQSVEGKGTCVEVIKWLKTAKTIQDS
jgi:serine/threonine-protein kinase RsbT